MAEYVPVGWSRRAGGAVYFTDTRRHLRAESVDVHDARTLCGVKIPPKVLNPPRTHDLFRRLYPMDELDLAKAEPCARCHRKAQVKEPPPVT